MVAAVTAVGRDGDRLSPVEMVNEHGIAPIFRGRSHWMSVESMAEDG
ncbi:MAG: hypothetical protein VKJ64_06675 [Leptolyngbyaceae bacterium]|nr:hypothetical protein [Leptolyngbyaceae bacterium]